MAPTMRPEADPAAMRTAIVTGAASGIGRGLAEELAAKSVFVVLADRQVELAQQAADGIREKGGDAVALELDVRDLARFRETVDLATARWGRLDFLFNNAGIAVGAEADDLTAADWVDVIDVNLKGVAHGVLAAYPLMIRQGFGHIVNTASMAGLVPAALTVSYTATKYAVVGLSRALRIEARRHGVKVSVICPGIVRTPIWDGGRFGRIDPSIDRVEMARQAEFLHPPYSNDFARKVLRAVEKNRAVIVEPKWWRVFWYLERLSPWLVERLAERLVRTALPRFRRTKPSSLR